MQRCKIARFGFIRNMHFVKFDNNFQTSINQINT